MKTISWRSARRGAAVRGGGRRRPAERLVVQPLEPRLALAIDVSLVADLAPGIASSISTAILDGVPAFAGSTVAADTLFFGTTIATTAAGIDTVGLWKRSGNAAPELLATLGSTRRDPASDTVLLRADQIAPAQFTRSGGLVYFTSAARDTGETAVRSTLWRTDGTAAGTFQIHDQVTSSSGSNGGRASPYLVDLDGILLFAGFDPSHGVELWRTTGTAAGTSRIADINPSEPDSEPGGFTRLGSIVLFAADDGARGRELWKTDGTAGGTGIVADIVPGTSAAHGSGPQELTPVGAAVVFSADDGVHGRELWRTDGTAGGTSLLADINTLTGSGGGSPAEITSFGSLAYFSADDGVHGRELWRTDGTPAGTLLFKDLDPTVIPPTSLGPPFPQGSQPRNFVAAGRNIFFAASTAGRESLWVTDGSPAGTVQLPEPDASATGSQVGELVALGDEIFAGVTRSTNGGAPPARVLVRSIGTGTAIVALAPGVLGTQAEPLAAASDRLYFAVDDGAHGREVWQYRVAADPPPPAPPPAVIAVGIDGSPRAWAPEFAFTAVGPARIRLTGIPPGPARFFPLRGGIALAGDGAADPLAARITGRRYDTRGRTLTLDLDTPLPGGVAGGIATTSANPRPAARLIDADSGALLREVSGDQLVAAGYSAAFAARFQGGLRAAAGNADRAGAVALAVAPGGLPLVGRAALARGYESDIHRIALFAGAAGETRSTSIDVGAVFGTAGESGYAVALGDVVADADQGVELVVAAGRRIAVFDLVSGTGIAAGFIDPAPLVVVDLAAEGRVGSIATGPVFGGPHADIVVASSTGTGRAAGGTTVTILGAESDAPGVSLAVRRRFAAIARVESGPSLKLVDIFAQGASLAVGDFDGDSRLDLALGANAGGLGSFRVLANEFLTAAGDQLGSAAIADQLGPAGRFAQARAPGGPWKPLGGPDYFTPGEVPRPIGLGFNAPVAVATATTGGTAGSPGRAGLFVALGATSQTGGRIRRFAFTGPNAWSIAAEFEQRSTGAAGPFTAASGLRLG